ncbi:MAG: beta strand repeat-containing protein, partial [Verrucomicrobiota bacterium]
INGTGIAALAANFKGALWNSSPVAATLSGTITLGSASSVGGSGDLTLSGNVTGAFALTKTGDNTLTLSASGNTFTTLAVNLGVLRLGNAAALGGTADGTTISSGAVLDLNGFSVGAEPLSITGAGFAGSGTITGRGTVTSLGALINSSASASTYAGAVTLAGGTSIGGSRVNALSGVTSGDITLSGVVSGNQTLTKVGTNTLTLTAANTYDATTINLGRIIVSGAGTLGDAGTVTIQGGPLAASDTLLPGTRLTLDNGGTASSLRLSARPVTFNGGHLELLGHASTAVNEALGTDVQLGVNVAHNVISLDNVGANLRITTAGTGTLASANQATLFIRGDALGQGAGATNTNIILATTTAPTNWITVVGQGGANAAANKQIFPWAVADTSVTSTGTTAATQFLVNDGSTNGLRPLNASTEMSTPGVSGSVVANNNNRINATGVTLGAAATVLTTTVLNSLTFESGGALVINNFRDLRLDSGGILAKSSNTITVAGTGLGVGSINARDSGTNARTFFVHVMGSANTLTSNATFGGVFAPTSGGLAKTGDGRLLLNSASGSNYTGTTTISLGTLELAAAAPNNALFYRFATSRMSETTTADNDDALVVTAGGTLELGGNSQVFGDLLARTSTVGSGGIINNAGTTATFITTVNTARDWTGQINGNLNFVKSGGTQLTVRDNNQFNGNATLMGSITALTDQGRFSGMASGDTISIRNSLLRWDDSGIQAMSNRFSSAVGIQLDGGAFEYVSRSGTVGSVSLGDLSLTGGTSILRANPGSGGLGQASVS